MNKEYKKVLKQVYIDNCPSFNLNMDKFLDNNPEVKILHTIVHQPYHVTIIYQELKEI